MGARLTANEKSLLKRAAELHGQSLSAYVVERARAAAVEDLEAASMVVLGQSEQQRFIELIMNPNKPSAPLRHAIRGG